MIMSDGHLVGRRGVLRGLALGLLGAATGCSEGGGSSSPVDSKKAEEIKQRKLDSMKEILQKKQGARRSP
jgi:hypothetical protein